jgi:hypothetical protein
MVDKEKVFELFALFADLDKDFALRYRPFCDAAASLLSYKAKTGLKEEDLERLATAAAGYAYCDWLDLTGGLHTAEEIKVGDISVKNSAGSGKAATTELRQHFEGLVADLLEPAFVFGQTAPPEVAL